MLYLRYTEGRIYSKIYAGFKDIYAVAEFVFKLPDDEIWIDCWDDDGNNLNAALRKIVTNRQRKVLEIKQRIKDLEKDFEDNT